MVKIPSANCQASLEERQDSRALRQTHTTLGNPLLEWHPWILFSLHALTRQKDNLLNCLAAERTALATLTPLARSISQLLDRPSRVSVASIVSATGASHNTVKATLSRLVSEGLLVRHGAGRAVHYTRR